MRKHSVKSTIKVANFYSLCLESVDEKVMGSPHWHFYPIKVSILLPILIYRNIHPEKRSLGTINLPGNLVVSQD